MSAFASSCGHATLWAIGSYVPIGDLSRCSKHPLLNYFVGNGEQSGRHLKADRPGGVEVEDQLEFG
jgi:hypothetical protein